MTTISKVDPTPPVKVPVYHDVDYDSMTYKKIASGIVGGIAGLVMYYHLYFFFM